MKVLRNLLVALSFGFMMSCSSPVDKAMDQVEAVIEKMEAAKSADEIVKLNEEYEKALDGVVDAFKEELGKDAKPEDAKKAAEKYDKRSDELKKRYKEALEKLSK